MELQQTLEQCEQLIRDNSTSFYRAFSTLPSPQREAVFVIYAFCRLIDNSVDEPEQSPFTLEELEMQFKQLETAQGHFIWPSLRWLFACFPLSQEPFFRQMTGQRRDGILTHYNSMKELEEYCYLVAGTVGEMLLPVLHPSPDKEVVEAGIYLGKAMQVVNIIRDVGADMQLGRRYLPLDLMNKHHYTAAEFERREVNAKFIAMLNELTELADHWFALGLSNLNEYPAKSAFAVELAASYYRAIIDEVIRIKYNVYRRRAVVGALAKKRIYTSLKSKYNALSSEERHPDGEAVS
ncbi:phytoene/squalene synthase family protein [Paenibacillus glycanilyticus]|uniref:phytoene/squalene synthase family protein n=1 Tax=Paenibacillus glycanilyticus TaxID=126569 RepID=UPI003EB70D36